MNRSGALFGWHTKTEMSITIYFTLVNFPQSLCIRIFVCSLRMRFPFKLYSCLIEFLFNLTEIYIRNSPHCRQSHCSWPKHRASKHELLLKIYTLYIISPIAKMTWTTINILKSKLQFLGCSEYNICNFSHIQVKLPSWPWMCSRD